MHQSNVLDIDLKEHLVLGSRFENMQDAKLKGRLSIGENHGRSKLTSDQVDLIKKSIIRLFFIKDNTDILGVF